MGNLSFGERLLASLFQSVTCRTAGFNTIDIGSLTGPSKALSCMLMFIGGSSGSTAGGIKTVTFVILVFLLISSLRGHKEVVIRRRRVNNSTLFKAIAVTGSALMVLTVGVFIISVLDPNLGFSNIIYECVSAMGTVGLSTGITPYTGTVTRIILILIMFFGRVGILSISISLLMKADREKAVVSHPVGDFITG
jgi:trk system potassium uptake protein